MRKMRIGETLRIWAAGAAILSAAACTHSDWHSISEGLTVVADEMAVTMTMVPSYGCDYNAQGYAVCDDNGDGWADRYASGWDRVGVYAYAPPTRVNDYGEAFQYDGRCDCWYREPSLDTYPK